MKTATLTMALAATLFAQDAASRRNWPHYGATPRIWRHGALDVCTRPATIRLALLLQMSPVATGEKIFAQSCSVGYCHGAAGAAARGPRLRGRAFDKNYLYGVIRDGIPKSAMPAWKDRFKEDEIRATVA